jgi:hypothetical protein
VLVRQINKAICISEIKRELPVIDFMLHGTVLRMVIETLREHITMEEGNI